MIHKDGVPLKMGCPCEETALCQGRMIAGGVLLLWQTQLLLEEQSLQVKAYRDGNSILLEPEDFTKGRPQTWAGSFLVTLTPFCGTALETVLFRQRASSARCSHEEACNQQSHTGNLP